MHAGWVYPKVSRAPKRRRVELPTELQERLCNRELKCQVLLIANRLRRFYDDIEVFTIRYWRSI